MITLGFGSPRGGVGSSVLCLQLAALLQRAGLRVTIVGTSPVHFDRHWCVRRATRQLQALNVPSRVIRCLRLDEVPGRLCDQEFAADVVLLDYSFGSGLDIVAAMSHVEHWICPVRPRGVRETEIAYRSWQMLHPNAGEDEQSFSAVLSLAPGSRQIEFDPSLASSEANGSETLETLAAKWPELHIFRQRLTKSQAASDVGDGGAAFESVEPDAAAASREFMAVWDELRQHLTGEGVLSGFPVVGRFRASHPRAGLSAGGSAGISR